MPVNNLITHMRRLQAFADNYQQTSEGIVRKYGNVITDLQKDQLTKGVNSVGAVINPPYRPFTIAEKERYGVGIGRITSHVTYFSTGELWSLLKTMVASGKFTIKADTFKFGKAEQRSGQKTFGLTKESRTEFRDYVSVPEMQAAYREQVTR